jgi:hypothetical protein
MRNYAQRWPKHWRFVTIIVGWCNVNRTLEAYQLIPGLDTRVVVKSKRLDVSQPVAIGTGVKDFTDKLNSLRDREGPSGKAVPPLLAVEALVAGDVREDVGGDIQLGYATSNGFQILSRSRPVISGKPEARRTFLGLDINELGDVGSCRVGMPALAFGDRRE